ncbi:toll/interleukin-1 receptor domain-containing protein [Streptomyces europaeiscabiei]|uniref:toll/interleukin-1 receptor domain-containing protein n=1 Tax=Streptomyces europaeiscabiei TaxID=146819 RepID=UPI0029A35555|nr:toll/interleukin-1 receptor domain-containing protein [Streptomyces europaeiscabiei]MDX3611307.1 toll/interleukin-1 receptor domain-containing protein [Streptomyces europaeiscabiei]
MPGVFVSYRNADEPYAAALIDLALKERLGAERVFRASRSNTPGNDFRDQIVARLMDATVVLPVIGPRWIECRDEEGRLRLWQEEDWVRREIAIAFEHGKRVIPVYATGASAPKEEELPSDIGQLAFQHGVRLHHRSVETDMERLVAEVEKWVPELRVEALLESVPTAPPWGLPSAALRPEYQVVPFREPPGAQYLDKLMAWCEQVVAPPALMLTAPGGHGKSRLARELCERLRGRGWSAGLVTARSSPEALARIQELRHPTLLVFDAAEARQEQLAAALTVTARRLPDGPPVRLLLLARSHGDWFDKIPLADDWAADLHHRIEVWHLSAPTGDPAWREQEFNRAVRAFAAGLGLRPPRHRSPPAALDGQESYLELHGAALESVLEPVTAPPREGPTPAGPPPADTPTSAPHRSPRTATDAFGRMLDLEIAYWRQVAKAFELPADDSVSFEQTAAAATLFGAADHREAVATLAALPAFRSVPDATVEKYITWAQAMYPGPAALNPLRPRQVGETQAARAVLRSPGLLDCLPGLSDAQMLRAWTVLGRVLIRDDRLRGRCAAVLAQQPERLVLPALDAALVVEEPGPLLAEIVTALHDVEPATLIAVLASLPQRSLVLAETSAVLTRMARTALHRLPDPDPLEAARLSRQFAQRCSQWGECLEEARAAAEEAVAGFARLAADDAELKQELAEAHAVHALILMDTGNPVEAVAAGDEAVRLYRSLATAPGRDRIAGLVTALNNQAVRSARCGDSASALAQAQEAVTLARGLVRENRAAHLSLLADCLDTLSVRTHETDAAVRVCREALGLREVLTARRPDAYEPALAGTSHNLSVLLARQGHTEEARQLALRATELYDRAAARHPGRFTEQTAVVGRWLARLAAMKEKEKR